LDTLQELVRDDLRHRDVIDVGGRRPSVDEVFDAGSRERTYCWKSAIRHDAKSGRRSAGGNQWR
jgi:hypothetical protein